MENVYIGKCKINANFHIELCGKNPEKGKRSTWLGVKSRRRKKINLPENIRRKTFGEIKILQRAKGIFSSRENFGNLCVRLLSLWLWVVWFMRPQELHILIENWPSKNPDLDCFTPLFPSLLPPNFHSLRSVDQKLWSRVLAPSPKTNHFFSNILYRNQRATFLTSNGKQNFLILIVNVNFGSKSSENVD